MADHELEEISEIGFSEIKQVSEKDTKVSEFNVMVVPDLVNPYMVVNGDEKKIGTAVLEFVQGGVQVKLFLDHHTPERFLYETDPGRVRIFLPEMQQDLFLGYVRVFTR